MSKIQINKPLTFWLEMGAFNDVNDSKWQGDYCKVQKPFGWWDNNKV